MNEVNENVTVNGVGTQDEEPAAKNNETKAEKFIRLGEYRMNKAIDAIENAILYIEEHLDGKVDLESVADAVHYSKYHLHRMFTATVGMTLHDYVQRRQLTEAAKLLVFSDKPVLDIAMSCGFHNTANFNRIFLIFSYLFFTFP